MQFLTRLLYLYLYLYFLFCVCFVFDQICAHISTYTYMKTVFFLRMASLIVLVEINTIFFKDGFPKRLAQIHFVEQKIFSYKCSCCSPIIMVNISTIADPPTPHSPLFWKSRPPLITSKQINSFCYFWS